MLEPGLNDGGFLFVYVVAGLAGTILALCFADWHKLLGPKDKKDAPTDNSGPS